MPSDSNKEVKSRMDVFFIAAALLVGLSVWQLAAGALRFYIENPIVDLRGNIDWGYLNTGLNKVHCFRDTARWWTGTWCGQVPFWRPLTSYVFWVMKLLWRPEYMLPRQIILVILHLCFTATAGILTWMLTRRKWLVLLSLFLFAGLRPYPLCAFFGTPCAVGDVLSDPKNITDPLVGIAMMSSLIFLMARRWIGALVAAVVSVGFKEVGFMTWPIAVVVLAWVHRDRLLSTGSVEYVVAGIKRNRVTIVLWMTALCALAAIHLLAVGVGYNCGTNGAWYWRALAYFGGPLGAQLVTRDIGPPIVAFLLFLAILITRRSSLLPRFGAVLAALAVGILIDSYLQHTPYEVSMVRIMTYNLDLRSILIEVAWLLVAWEARHNWQTVALGGIICFLAAAPSWMAAQALDHTRYVSSFFMEIVVAAALCQSMVTVSRECHIARSVFSRTNGSQEE